MFLPIFLNLGGHKYQPKNNLSHLSQGFLILLTKFGYGSQSHKNSKLSMKLLYVVSENCYSIFRFDNFCKKKFNEYITRKVYTQLINVKSETNSLD